MPYKSVRKTQNPQTTSTAPIAMRALIAISTIQPYLWPPVAAAAALSGGLCSPGLALALAVSSSSSVMDVLLFVEEQTGIKEPMISLGPRW